MRVNNYLKKHWFLIALTAILVVGIVGSPALGAIASLKTVRSLLVASVLFVMALPLEIRAMWDALRRPGPPLLAVTINLGVLPLVAWAVSLTLSHEMGLGLLVAATTPSTLASAAVWTRRAGGNDAVAILVTMITNVSCFVVTPMWLVITTGQAVDSPELSLPRMVSRLALLVVLPMAAAQLLRCYRPLARAATAGKPALSVLAQCGILAMVMFGAVGTGESLRASSAAAPLFWDLLQMLAAVLLLHISMLWLGIFLARQLHFPREDQIAVAFSGSQKTLMVGLLMGISLQITILPMVTYHILQLVVDTFVADRFRHRTVSREPNG